MSSPSPVAPLASGEADVPDTTVREGYLLSTESEPRVRRSRDAIRVTLGVILLLITGRNAVRFAGTQQAFFDFTEALPGWTEVLFWIGYGVAALYVVTMVVVLLLRFGNNRGAALDVLASLGVAAAIAVLIVWIRDSTFPTLLPEFGAAEPELQFPIVRVAIVTAVVLALSPHVNRSLRRFGGALVGLVALSGLGLGFGFPTDALAAISVGLIAAGGVLLLFGSPTGFPNPAVVAGALAQLGLHLEELHPAPDQSWGTRRFFGTDKDGNDIQVKAYGRDAADTQFAAKVWRALWYRDTGPAAGGRMQAVEHEALMALFAGGSGVATNEPITAGKAGDDVAILVAPRRGVAISGLASESLSDDLLIAVWRDVATLHDNDMAHGSLTADVVFATDRGHVLDEFSNASLAAGDRTHLDVVTLLFSLTNVVGSDRAVSTAISGLGSDRLAAALPYLQVPALTYSQRRAAVKPKNLVKDLRAQVAEATGVVEPDPVKLRRVSLGSLLMLLLILFAVNALISQLVGIDFAAVWGVVSTASFFVLFVALAVGQINFFFEATGMSAAVGMAFPFRPLISLQYASRFLSLAVPSAAGRVAMNTAFLVKYGVHATKAVVQGAIDGFSGFIVEAGILVIALLVSDASFALGGDTNWQRILAIVVGVVIVGLIVAFSLKRIRALIMPVLRQAWEAVSGVLTDPRRTIVLFGSNFLSRLVLGIALWLILRAVGVDDIGIAVALVVTVATNLLAGLTPVPGGVGVAEAVLTSWLVLVGVPEAEAFATTITFRMWTFYLPAVLGGVSMRWLERNDYL